MQCQYILFSCSFYFFLPFEGRCISQTIVYDSSLLGFFYAGYDDWLHEKWIDGFVCKKKMQ